MYNITLKWNSIHFYIIWSNFDYFLKNTIFCIDTVWEVYVYYKNTYTDNLNQPNYHFKIQNFCFVYYIFEIYFEVIYRLYYKHAIQNHE